MTTPTITTTPILIQHQDAATLGDVLSGYVNHIGTTIDHGGNVFAAPTQDGPGAGDVDVVIMRRDYATGAWEEVFRFSEAAYGKPGYGSLEMLPNGDLCCCLSQRNAAGQVVFQEHLIPRSVAKTAIGARDSVVRGLLRTFAKAITGALG